MSSLVKWFVTFPYMQYGLGFLQEFMVKVLRTGPIPRHVAFIMDGNRRFAKYNQLELKEGHVAGFDSLMHILEFCNQLGIEAVTIYAFSIENFNRPQHEVDALMGMLRSKIVFITDEDSFAKRSNIKLRVLGDRSLIPDDILEAVLRGEEATKDNTGMLLNICFPYTARDDITHAIREVSKKVEANELSPDDINMETFQNEMYTGKSPPLDILVRTSGATRLSDFMLWESNTNCKVKFVESLWPDFTIWDMYRICIKWSYERTKELT
jgi:ditrans,polycis-polyprenyl diphosphate synthase